MNKDQIQGSLKQFSGKLKEKWSTLNDDPLGVIAAKRYQIAAHTQIQQGIAQEESELQIKAFNEQNRNWHNLSATPGVTLTKVSASETSSYQQ